MSNTQMTWLLVATLLSVYAAGCSSSSDVIPYLLTIDSKDVAQSAVTEIEINISPDEISRKFAFDPAQTYATDQIETELTAAGSFVIRVSSEWIQSHATPGTDSFRVELPLYSVGGNPPDLGDPTLQVAFLSGSDRIAFGTVKIPWPLPEGDFRRVLVACQMDFLDRCAGGSPSAVDGGT